jgi:hypothetical protein
MSVLEYWKEISLLLSAGFAVAAIFWEPKNKISGKITIWGRCLMLLTVVLAALSIVGQFRENSETTARNDRVQREMLVVLNRTERTIFELARVLQPIENPIIDVEFEIDCASIRYREFCRIKQHDVEKVLSLERRHHGDVTPVQLGWEDYPEGRAVIIPLHAYFFRKSEDAENFIRSGCFLCPRSGDLDLNLSPDNYSPTKSLSLRFDVRSRRFLLASYNKTIRAELNSREIMSLVDFPGTTMIIAESNGYLNDLKPTMMLLRTPRGQSITIPSFETRVVGNQRLFIHRFPT